MKETILSVIYDFGNRRTVTKRGGFDLHLEYLATLPPAEIANLKLINRDELDKDEKFLLANLRAILASYQRTQVPSDFFNESGECMCSMEYSGCSCPGEKKDSVPPRFSSGPVPQWTPPGMFDAVHYTSQLLSGSLSPSAEEDCDCEEDGFCFHDDECDCDFGCENCDLAPVMSNEPNVNVLSDANDIRRIARNRVLENLRDKIHEALSDEDFNPIVTFRAGNWLGDILDEKGYKYVQEDDDHEPDIFIWKIDLAGGWGS